MMAVAVRGGKPAVAGVIMHDHEPQDNQAA